MFKSRVAAVPIDDRSLPFHQMLEQEYRTVGGIAFGDAPVPAAVSRDDLLDPVALARRFCVGLDRVAVLLRSVLPPADVQALDATLSVYEQAANAGDEAAQREALARLLLPSFTLLLATPDLYTAHVASFAGITFRSETRDRFADGDATSIRLVLEDVLPELAKLSDARLRALYQAAHDRQFSALCLSGGGIRSATFSLGVLQGLARKGLLGKFDYLSTVSGGGYIGGWLSAWINRTSEDLVTRQLGSATDRPLDPESGPIEHLRAYNNYLTPKLGFFSADTWALIATYIRNLLLNWLVLVPLLISVATLPQVLIHIVSWQPTDWGVTLQSWARAVAAVIALGAGVAAVRFIHANRPEPLSRAEGHGLIDAKRSQRDFLRSGLLPLVTSAFSAMIWWAWTHSTPDFDTSHMMGLPRWLAFAAVASAVHLTGWLLTLPGRTAIPDRSGWVALREGLVVIASGVLLGAAASVVAPAWEQVAAAPRVYVWLTFPMMLALILTFSHLYVGYTSRWQVDAEREWSARFSGWLLIVIVAWVGGVGLVFYGVDGWLWLGRTLRGDGLAQLLIAVVGGACGIRTVLVSGGPATPGSGAAPAAGRSSTGPLVLATIFFACLLVVLAIDGGALLGIGRRIFDPRLDTAWDGSGWGTALEVVILAALAVFALVSAFFIDTNKFSLHAMYRARLIRAYLGASRPSDVRDPNGFTGFDDADNLYLCKLRPVITPDGKRSQPLHVINATLNLVSGQNLAWQQRKAESFTFSPLHCGSANVGYRGTAPNPGKLADGGYGGRLGVSLGTAMAISGAAASPNMGYHSSPVLSLLLTFFNARLGWWLGNPGHAGRKVYHDPAPDVSLGPLINEALGKTDDESSFVYLSDGGHFENLGLYEMVLRRCRTIVVCDASADASTGFENLGNAIRKIRIDLGIPIVMDQMLTLATGERRPSAKGGSRAIGTIDYSCVDGGDVTGTLIYIKPALDIGESIDVFNYSTTSSAFPHESTVDQWFSESQFESYRALGSHIVDQIVPDPVPAAGATMQWLIEQARTAGR